MAEELSTIALLDLLKHASQWVIALPEVQVYLAWRWRFFEQIIDAEPAPSHVAHAQMKFGCSIRIIALTSFPFIGALPV